MSAVERAAAIAVAAASARLAERLGEALPGARVAVAPEGVVVSGRGLARRRLADPALRWPAGLLR